jgi:hypothetical protein
MFRRTVTVFKADEPRRVALATYQATTDTCDTGLVAHVK